MPTLIVPNDYFSASADPHFAAEAEAAAARGWRVLSLDQAKLEQGMIKLRQIVDGDTTGPALYRGWMLNEQQYRQFHFVLVEMGAEPLTSPAQYLTAHQLPGWYQQLQAFTPYSVWTEQLGADDLRNLIDSLSQRSEQAIVKDFVKSYKSLWDEACFIPDLADTEHALQVINRFIELQDERLNGGIVLRQYEDLLGYEARSWWRDGQCLLISAHPDTPEQQVHPVISEQLSAAMSDVGGLVTADLCQRADGQWRVVEIGDAQVSDRPASLSAERLLDALLP